MNHDSLKPGRFLFVIPIAIFWHGALHFFQFGNDAGASMASLALILAYFVAA